MSDVRALRVDPQRFRRVLGNYPTGVTVVTAIDADSKPAGMALGSFTSVSLNPPLVAFLADKNSTSFPRIRTATSFCVNVLSAHQEEVCRAFATRGGDKFAGVGWSPAPSGAPRLDGVAAWIDCDFESITHAGDHYLVLGRVRELDGADDGFPLVFYRGGYGRFSPSSLVTVPEPDVIGHLRHADLARGAMERISAELGVECVATAAVDEQLVVVAGVGTPVRGSRRSRVGQRSPFLPPLGALFVAGDESAAARWLISGGTELDNQQRAELDTMLERVRERGWSLGLADDVTADLESALEQYSSGDRSAEHLACVRRAAAATVRRFEPPDVDHDTDYRVRLISAPVRNAEGQVVLLLTLWGPPRRLSGTQINAYVERLRAAAATVSDQVCALTAD